MGLDNIPNRYPCNTAGTAVLVDGQIDCSATQEQGGCPWKAARLGGGAVYGIFGTDCWYRGKVGTWMLNTLAEAGTHLPEAIEGGFYGEDNDLSPEYCRALASWMEDHGELYLTLVPAAERSGEAMSYRYAVAWLQWVADQCEGANAWW